MAESSRDPERDPRWDAVRAAARRRVPTPPGLVDRVLRAVTRGRRTAAGDGGRAVTGHLVRAIAADHAPDGVLVSAVAVEDGVVQVHVTVRSGVAAGPAAEALRQAVTAGLSRRLGVTPAVNVHVVAAGPGTAFPRSGDLA
ncbi:hypothetical protein [Amycolatopsis sp. cmx-4-68]|uniref:hypothetical protein n=1 Tax=Amycolatopsis sp. cmx-4-68 TaxID=2790938 RepID=UPI0039786576